MNKTDLDTLNGYLFNTFNSVVKLDDKFNIEICYTTRLNTSLQQTIFIPDEEKLTINSFYKYLTNKSLIDLINFYLNEFEKIERNELKEKIKKTKL